MVIIMIVIMNIIIESLIVIIIIIMILYNLAPEQYSLVTAGKISVSSDLAELLNPTCILPSNHHFPL